MIEYRPIGELPSGTLYRQLADAYSFCADCQTYWDAEWKAYDAFFYAEKSIAERYGFVTVADGAPVGHVTWDPRKLPAYAILGHNCIVTRYQGKGFGKAQLGEAVLRIRTSGAQSIRVTTNAFAVPAIGNYERAGFVRTAERENADTPFAGSYIDYILRLTGPDGGIPAQGSTGEKR